MSRSTSVSAIALALVTLALAAPASSAARGRACASAPRALGISRLAGPRARLHWRSAGSAGAVFRVLRSGRTVAQTKADSLVLSITPGRRTTFVVQARVSGAVCSARLRVRLRYRPPGRVSKLRVLSLAAGALTVGWRAAPRGDGRVGGYRVLRDGAVVGQTHHLRFALKLTAGRSHTVAVAAVDTRGRVGAPSKQLTFAGRSQRSAPGRSPSAPAGLGAAEVSEAGARVYWLASRPAGARIVGYRVYRDGALVGQTAETTLRLAHLSFPHTYAVTVSAIDAAKHESQRSAALQLSTSHLPPSGPSLLSAARVTDTSATLSWTAGAANSGALAGYALFKDGQEIGVVRDQIDTVVLASQRQYVFTVRALDSAGYLSAASPALTVVTTHTQPSTPSALSASQVTSQSAELAWAPSTPVSGTIVGYRVFRDGIPVGETAGAQMTLTSLAPSSDYVITVTAVDSLGAVSEPSAPLALHTAEPVPTHGTAQAFLLASTDQSFTDLEAHYQQIGVVYPTYFDCGVAGEVLGKDDPLVTGWALARKIAVLPRVNCQNVNDENQILNEPAARQAMIDKLASLCQTYGYDGVQIDFEGAAPAERDAFTAFIKALSERLHAQNDKLSTIVTAKTYNVPTGRAAMYDDAALSGYSDWIFVLDWGLHWTTSGPGSIDELPWFKRVAEYAATMPNRERFVLGMPMYGIDWPNGGGSGNAGTPLEFSNVVALESELGVLPQWDEVAASPHFSYTDASGTHHDVWYTDQQSIGMRAALASSLGLGVGLWHLGSEDQGVWNLPQLGGTG